MGIGESHPLARELIEMRRRDLRILIVGTEVAVPEIVGENHDDPNTHTLELAILQELSAKGRPVTLAMEMFERDVQPVVDDYLAGRLAERVELPDAQFLSN